MATFLITGVAGFIGSGLARAILERGHKLRGIDNFSTGKRENISDILSAMDFREIDIRNVGALREVCRGVDYILHEAAIPSVPRSVEDPSSSHETNATGTLNLLIAARDAGVKRVIYAGSSSAYGDQPSLPKHEEMVPSPISPYAVSKLAGEHYLQAFAHCYGMETVTLRYFNVFGPRQDANSQYSAVLAKFITLMLAGERPTIYGDGEQTRDFTYIDNVIEANVMACTAPAERVSGKAFNVATGERISLNRTFATLKQLLQFHDEPIHVEERAGDIKHSFADISLARQNFGYEPSIDFREGLQRTIEWYRNANAGTAK